jgi:hypothetical protein
VKFIFNSFRYKLSEFVRIAKVQTVNITSKGDNLTGKISGGYVCLTGPLKKTSQGKPRKHNEWYDEDHDGSGDRATKNTYHFLMGYAPHKSEAIELRVGLIIEKIEEREQYRRIGVFVLPLCTCKGKRRDDSKDWMLKPLVLGQEHPEFASFDLKNHERHTVTLI